MKSTLILATALALASSAGALPQATAVYDAIERRATYTTACPAATAHVGSAFAGKEISLPAGQYATAASATFAIPTPRVPSGGNPEGEFSGAVWVGFMHDTRALFQAGCTYAINPDTTDANLDGTTPGSEVVCWAEFYPDGPRNFHNLSPGYGATMAINIHQLSPTSGAVTITNKSSGKVVSTTISASVASETIVQPAEVSWLLEREGSGCNNGVSDFGTIHMTGCGVTTNTGAVVGTSGGETFEILAGGRQVTSSSGSGSEVTINYVPA